MERMDLIPGGNFLIRCNNIVIPAGRFATSPS
jgi:hypothetical protein